MRALSRLSLGRVAAALGKEATATRAACLLVHSAPRWWTMGAERVALAAGLRAARCTPMLGGAAGSRATQTAAGLGDEGRGTPEGVGTPAADPPGEEEMMGGPPGREHELWARAYACPTCDARFARWHKCLSHMKKQQVSPLFPLPHTAPPPRAIWLLPQLLVQHDWCFTRRGVCMRGGYAACVLRMFPQRVGTGARAGAGAGTGALEPSVGLSRPGPAVAPAGLPD